MKGTVQSFRTLLQKTGGGRKSRGGKSCSEGIKKSGTALFVWQGSLFKRGCHVRAFHAATNAFSADADVPTATFPCRFLRLVAMSISCTDKGPEFVRCCVAGVAGNGASNQHISFGEGFLPGLASSGCTRFLSPFFRFHLVYRI